MAISDAELLGQPVDIEQRDITLPAFEPAKVATGQTTFQNFTLLASDTVAAGMDEALPDGVKLHALSINSPALWEEQRQWEVGVMD